MKKGARRPLDPYPAGTCPKNDSGVVLRFQHLAATIHAALQVDMVRTMQFAGIRIFHVSRLAQRVMAAALAALHLGNFTSGDRHGFSPLCRASRPVYRALGFAPYSQNRAARTAFRGTGPNSSREGIHDLCCQRKGRVCTVQSPAVTGFAKASRASCSSAGSIPARRIPRISTSTMAPTAAPNRLKQIRAPYRSCVVTA